MADNVLVVEIDLEKGDTRTAFNGIGKDAKVAGKRSGVQFSDGFKSGLKNLAKIASAATAIIGGIITKQSIDAAARQEDAINALNSALQITGRFSEQTSQSLQDYASSLQAVTKFGDEAILETQALIQSLGDLDEKGLKRATAATLDLAAALRIDLNSAATLVGKAAAGEVGSFSRYGVSIKKAETNALTFSNALDALENKFGGAAAKQVNTFSGATEQLGNTFGDLLEEIGFIITKSPLLIGFIKSSEKAFRSAAIQVKQFAETFSFSDLALDLININKAIIENIISPLELVGNVATFIGLRVAEGLNAIVASLGFVGGKIAEFLTFIGVDGAAGLKTFADSSNEIFQESAQKSGEAFNSIFDFPFTDKLAMANESLREGLASTNEIIDDSSSKAQDSLKKIGNQAASTSKQTATILKGAFVKAISGSIQTVIKAISAGENAFAALGNFLFNIFGDLAIQLGEFFIAQGIAIEALRGVQGAGAIAAGIGLVALGSILKSFGGGGGSASAGAADGGGGTFGSTFEDQGNLASPDEIQRQTGSAISITVEGSLVQQEELGSFISKVISDSNEKSGNVIVSPRFA